MGTSVNLNISESFVAEFRLKDIFSLFCYKEILLNVCIGPPCGIVPLVDSDSEYASVVFEFFTVGDGYFCAFGCFILISTHPVIISGAVII